MADHNPTRETLLERRLQAFELHKNGVPYRAIGKQLGVTHAQAYRDVKWIIDDLMEKATVDIARFKRLTLERLNDVRRNVVVAARGGDARANKVLLGVIKRETRLLGLDAPPQLAVSGKLDVQMVREILADADCGEQDPGHVSDAGQLPF